MGHPQCDYANVKGYLSHLDNYIYMLGARLSLRRRGLEGSSSHLNCFGGGIQELNVIML